MKETTKMSRAVSQLEHMLSAYILSEFTIVCHLLTSLPVSSYLQKRDDLAISFLVDSPHIHKAVVLSPPQRTALRCKEYCGLDFFSAPHYNTIIQTARK